MTKFLVRTDILSTDYPLGIVREIDGDYADISTSGDLSINRIEKRVGVSDRYVEVYRVQARHWMSYERIDDGALAAGTKQQQR
jgi:hypothetical protein